MLPWFLASVSGGTQNIDMFPVLLVSVPTNWAPKWLASFGFPCLGRPSFEAILASDVDHKHRRAQHLMEPCKVGMEAKSARPKRFGRAIFGNWPSWVTAKTLACRLHCMAAHGGFDYDALNLAFALEI